MTFLEYVNKLLDEIKDNKSLDFKTADNFIQRINELNYQDGTKLSYEDKVKIIDLLKQEAEKRNYSLQYYINDSTNSRSLSVIAHMIDKINQNSTSVQNKNGGKNNGSK